MPVLLSLFDYSGSWSRPYLEAGYEVIQADLKHGQDVRTLLYLDKPVKGVLIAPPCTAFAGSGAQYWPKKDTDGTTLDALALVDAGLRAIAIYQPDFWALENPVGRLRKWLGPPRLMFHPCDYGDPYTKKTLLWGKFNTPTKRPVEPIRACTQGSWLQQLGGKSERTKELRSVTPEGFARAFFEANH
jgi:hypothetical protein